MSSESRSPPPAGAGAAEGLDPRRLRRAARGAAVFAIVIGLAVLTGWAFDFRPFMTVLPGLVAMKANTAIAFCCAGLSLFFFADGGEEIDGRRRKFSLALAGAVALIGGLTISEYLSGTNLGIDQFLFRDFAKSTAPGRMAPISAFNFVCLGIALICIRFPRQIHWAHGLTGCAMFTSLLALVGYFYGADALFKPSGYTAVAFHTAGAFLALSAGLLCATGRTGFMAFITGPGTSGKMARRYGIAAMIVPLTFGWLRLQGQLAGWYGSEVGVAIFAMSNVVTFVALVRIGAASLRASEITQDRNQESLHRAHLDLERRVQERTDELVEMNASLQVENAERKSAEKALRKSADDFQTMANNISQLAWMADATGYIFWYNDRWFDFTGTTLEEMAGWGWQKVHHPDHVTRVVEKITHCFQRGEIWDDTFPLRGRDGVFRWFLSQAVPIRDAEGNILRWFGTNTDVTENKNLEAELAVARDQALASARIKSEFLANMSHEIRTPMNGIIGMTSLLLESPLNSEQHQFASTVQSSAESLLTVINDILDFSKIEAGKLVFEDLDFDLREIVEEAVEMLANAAQIKGLELIGIVEPKVPGRLRGDPTRVRQIFINLLSNGVKFTAAGEVTLRISLEEEIPEEVLLRCEIRDTGIGITQEVRERLFQAFVQADGSTMRKFGGTGLGLVICQQLVQAMHGQIGIESTPGAGSTFWFTMRLGKQVELDPSVTPSRLEALRLLVVDDNATSRELLHQQITSFGFRNGCARNGEEALAVLNQAALANDAYPLAIIDSQMPGMDGFVLATKIKSNPLLQGMRLILLTSFAKTPPIEDLLGAGISACRAKPVRQSNLLDCITEVLTKESDRTPYPIADQLPLETLPAADSPPPTHPERILVAEDNEVNQRVALAHLRKLGYRADIAVNGREALKALLRVDYDIIFMDCQMPEMDGYEATAAIVAQTENRHRPWIIAMTAHSMAGDREKCLASGMNDYISKPARRVEIEAALARRKVDSILTPTEAS